jgi:hypothetical protein
LLETNLSVVTVDEKRVVSLIKNDFHDGDHDILGDLDLFGARHVNDNVLDTVHADERLISLWEIF